MMKMNLNTDLGFPTTPNNGDAGTLCLSSEASGW
jgi:hypothetical protein